MPAIGIDLGTSYSCVAVAQGGKVRVLADEQGQIVQPSIVHYPDRGPPLVGYPAREKLPYAPQNTVYSAKRLIGRRFDDAEVRASQFTLPYRVVRGPNDAAIIEVRGDYVSIPQVQAEILRYLRQIAERNLNEKVTDAVITVPANFNHAQRNSTQLAGKMAGLNVLRILNEPTAAALSYGMGRGYDKTLAIYDFGGGTFDFTLLDLQDRVFRTLSTAGDMLLGGDDLDLALAEDAARGFEKKHKVDLHRDVVEWQRLLFACEAAKRTLSEAVGATIQVTEVAHRAEGKLDVNHPVTRWQAHWLWKDLVGRSLAVLDRAFTDAQRQPDQVHEILLVGGTTFSPLVRALVEQYFRRRPRRDVDPLTAVAVGAAIQAHVLSAPPSPDPRALPALLLDVVPLTIGIAAAGGAMEPIIPRNTPVPVQQTRRFSTSRDGQTEVNIHVYQGDNPRYAENTYLGDMKIDGLRAAPAGQVDVDVTFEVDTDGILHISARDLDSGRAVRKRVKLGGDDEGGKP